jgi:hypothetical protein
MAPDADRLNYGRKKALRTDAAKQVLRVGFLAWLFLSFLVGCAHLVLAGLHGKVSQSIPVFPLAFVLIVAAGIVWTIALPASLSKFLQNPAEPVADEGDGRPALPLPVPGMGPQKWPGLPDGYR